MFGRAVVAVAYAVVPEPGRDVDAVAYVVVPVNGRKVSQPGLPTMRSAVIVATAATAT